MTEGASGWIIIDAAGTPVCAPWHDIDHDRGNTYLVKDGQGRWELIDSKGRLLVEPMALPPISARRNG